jgi:hypothetical protein
VRLRTGESTGKNIGHAEHYCADVRLHSDRVSVFRDSIYSYEGRADGLSLIASEDRL